MFFIVKINLECYVALSHLNPCQTPQRNDLSRTILFALPAKSFAEQLLFSQCRKVLCNMHAAKIISNKQKESFFSKLANHLSMEALAFTSLHCSISNYTLKGLRSDKPSHKHDSNKYQSKEFCNLRLQIRSDQICDAHKQNIPGLIDVLIAI